VTGGGAVTLTLESRVETVDGAEETARAFAGRNGFSEGDQYFIGLAIREILVNAIKHGNRFDPSKVVTMQLSGEPGELIVDVCDEGEGFQLAGLPDPLAEENLERRSGRGVAMAKTIMDTLTVDRAQPRGAHVRMSKRAAIGS
jgi:serine/threonine-protein kinase RsbW